MTDLVVGEPTWPWFGPGVIDVASRCPASGSVALRGWQRPVGAPRPPARQKMSAGAWPDAVALLKAVASRGHTSLWAAGTHPVTDLAHLARQLRLTGPSAAYAVAAVENLLDAQAATGAGFDFEPSFIELPFKGGTLHSGGVLAFRGPHGHWQAWRLRTGETLHLDPGWAVLAAGVLTGRYAAVGQLTRVEVFEVSGHTGEFSSVGSWDAQDVPAVVDQLVAEVLAPMARDLRVQPGSHCAGCSFVGACPATAAVPNLLHGVRRASEVRAVSASDLRVHADCPHRHHLARDLGLPAVRGLATDAMVRGAAVDQWLASMHRRGTPCKTADVRTLAASGAQHDVVAIASQHLPLCPLATPDATGLQVEPSVTALDDGSEVLLVARPDARYQVPDGQVWRETKTRTALSSTDPHTLVSSDITAALYLVLLASLPGADRLEWEQLSATESDLTMLFVDDKDLVDTARHTVSAAVADLLSDREFSPRPGWRCRTCPVHAWCPMGSEQALLAQ